MYVMYYIYIKYYNNHLYRIILYNDLFTFYERGLLLIIGIYVYYLEKNTAKTVL